MIIPQRHELAGHILVEIIKAGNRGRPAGKAAAVRIHAAFPGLSLAEVRAAINEVQADLQARADVVLAKAATKH